MPYKDAKRQLEYQRQWMSRRRADWLTDKSCVVCGSTDRLEIDHVDAVQKITHRVWSLKRERREQELAKCQVLCHRHHVEKTKASGESPHGERNGRTYLTADRVREIRIARRDTGESYSKLGQRFGLTRVMAWEVVNRTWKYLD